MLPGEVYEFDFRSAVGSEAEGQRRAGVVHLFVARTDAERRDVIRSIGPVWDGNEVWLLAAGGTLFFAFPALYATSFSGFYLPLTMVLWLLIGRAAGIEFRHHLEGDEWRPLLDLAFSVSSALLALFFGVALGNVVHGVPLDASGTFFEPLWTDFSPFRATGILDWYTLLVGLAAVAALAMHGALWVALKTAGDLSLRSRRAALALWWAVAALVAAVTLATFRVQPHVLERFRAAPWGHVLPAVAIAGLAAARVLAARGRERAAFLASAAFLSAMLASVAFGQYPYVLPSSGDPALGLTVRDAAAHAHGLRVGLAWWVPGIPWVNAAIDARALEVTAFVPDGPCFECGLDDGAWRRYRRRTSCGDGLLRAAAMGKVATVATLASLAAALQVEALYGLLHGPEARLLGLPPGNRLFLSLDPIALTRSELCRARDCLAHERWPAPIVAPLAAASASFADLAAWLERREGGAAATSLDLGFDLVTALRCEACGRDEATLRPKGRLTRVEALCPACRGPRLVGSVAEVAREDALANKLYAAGIQLGLEALEARFAEVERKHEVARAAERNWRSMLQARASVVFYNDAGEVASMPVDLVRLIASKGAVDGDVVEKATTVQFKVGDKVIAEIPKTLFVSLERILETSPWNRRKT